MPAKPAKKYLLNISQNYSFAILRPIQQAVLARGGQVAWFVQGNNVNLGYFHEDEHRLEHVDDVMRFQPDAVLYPANIAPTFFPGINVAIFHGFDAGKLDKKGRNDHFKVRHCFDLYCTQGPSSTVEFNRLAKIHQTFQVTETGWCALDRLFADKSEQRHIDEQSTDLPTILMCSTFSKKLTCAPHLFDTVKRLSATGKWRWLIQFHPKMNKDIVEQYKAIQNDYLTFVETDDVIPLLQQADVMVCDTSSVLIMFLLQHKPVVTFKNIAPKDYMLDIDDAELLEASITHALSRPTVLMDNIQRFIDETHPYQDGKSSERVLEAIDDMLAGNNLPKKRKPLNLLRQFKMRKELNYWKF